jgi:homoserine O-acetyltransferase
VLDEADTATSQRVVLFDEDDPLVLTCGRELAPVDVQFETYGRLDADRSNAVFVCHALTGDAQSAAPEGWWRTVVGPGLPIDTDRFFVISPNLLAGCRGTTGPSSIDPRTGEPYGLDFPPITMRDLVAVHRRLMAHLGIERLHAAAGGSLGGMQVLQWMLDAPEEVGRGAMICASSRLTPQNVALSAAARFAILSDPGFADGRYASNGSRPDAGLATARRLAHVTYLSERGMARKFEREDEPEERPPADARDWLASRYPVETYLDYQAEIFLSRFDALTYLYLSRVMDSFDPFATVHSVDPGLRALVLSFSSDWRFGPDHGARIARELRARGAAHVEDEVIETDAGHDAFLLRVPGYQERLAAFLAD